MQRVLVPEPPRLRRGAAWSAYRPGEERLLIGGDFFVCTELDDGRLGLAIGDVAGHGPEAAGFAAGLRSAWQGLVLTDGPLGELAGTLNRVALAQALAEDRYATALFCRVAADRRSAEVLSAGHPPMVLLHGDGAVQVDVDGGPPLGVLEDADWHACTVGLPAGAELLLYTDGLTEARTGHRDGLGPEQLLYEIDRLMTGGRRGAAMLDGLLELSQDAPAPDDVALLLVRLAG
jgi:serine phosphatase RsbU (regulator of sigma subunit)